MLNEASRSFGPSLRQDFLRQVNPTSTITTPSPLSSSQRAQAPIGPRLLPAGGLDSYHRLAAALSTLPAVRMLRSSIQRASRSTSIRTPTTALNAARAPLVSSHIYQSQQTRNSTHAISNPTLANIESRWELMPPQEQADLWMALRDRMKTDWHELTVPEKKAG